MTINNQASGLTGRVARHQIRVKEIGGWFVAGDSFVRALEILSDGAFRLFAWLCLRAHRPSGQIEATQRELAAALGKSKRAMSAYVAELERKGVCHVEAAANQHSRTRFEITENFWPYERGSASCSMPQEDLGIGQKTLEVSAYVATVRKMFLGLGCGKGSFGPADSKVAEEFARRGISLVTVEDALLMGEARKYLSWLNQGESTPIASLEYFRPVIEEILRQPLPAGYREYLKAKTRKFRRDLEERRDLMSTDQPGQPKPPNSDYAQRTREQDFAGAKK